MEPEQQLDTRWQEALKAVLDLPIPGKVGSRIRWRLDKSPRDAEEGLPTVPRTKPTVAPGIPEGALWEAPLARLVDLPIPQDLTPIIRKRFSEPVRHGLLAAAAVVILAAVGGLFALHGTPRVSDLPAVSAPVISLDLKGSGTVGVSVTRIGTAATPTPVHSAQLSADLAPTQALIQQTSIRVVLAPGSHLTGATLRKSGSTYIAVIRPVPDGDLLSFPVHTGSSGWMIDAVINGRDWVIRPLP